MNLKQLIVGTVIGGTLAAGQSACARDDTTDAINQLKQQIQELNEKVQTLEQKQTEEKEALETKAKETPSIVVGQNGLSVASGDSNFVFQLHGQIQADSRTFFHNLDNHGNAIQGVDGFYCAAPSRFLRNGFTVIWISFLCRISRVPHRKFSTPT